jgi:hypothetical protein
MRSEVSALFHGFFVCLCKRLLNRVFVCGNIIKTREDGYEIGTGKREVRMAESANVERSAQFGAGYSVVDNRR